MTLPNFSSPLPTAMPPGAAKEGLRLLLKARLTEEAIAAKYPEQNMRCPVHLSIGQEATAVGVSLCLKNDDTVVSTHRCHAHYLAKGGSVRAMMAELFGRSTGCSKGKGGSMHLIDDAVGMMGSSAIVGGSIPLAVGMALAFQLRKEPRVAVAYFGDGAVEQGVFHESLNFAALRKLPVLFVCENNEYATLSHLRARQPEGVSIASRAAAYGLPGVEFDGTDLSAVYAAAKAAVDRARNSEGPTLLVGRVYRWKEHVGPNEDHVLGVRTKEELDAWKAQDPVPRWRDAVVASGIVTPQESERMAAELNAEISEAIRQAEIDPYPAAEALMQDI